MTELDVSQRDITDLTDVEYFTALETLDCAWNRLTELDVSKSTLLADLICTWNELTTLDVRHNVALKALYCSGELHDGAGNYLTTLDLSYNAALEELYIDLNDLTILDIGQNSALVELTCSGNRLTTLDVRRNPALEKLFCDGNQLTMLDVSRNSSLEWLHCQSNLFPDRSAILGLEESRLMNFNFDPQDDRQANQSNTACPPKQKRRLSKGTNDVSPIRCPNAKANPIRRAGKACQPALDLPA